MRHYTSQSTAPTAATLSVCIAVFIGANGPASLARASAGEAAIQPPTQYVLSDLGSLGGNGPTSAYGINDRGQVFGQSSTSYSQAHAFVFDNGRMLDLKPGLAASSIAFGANNRGQVVGDAYFNPDFSHAFFYDSGQMIDLGVPSGDYSVAHAINDAGQIVLESGLKGFLLNGRTLTSPGQLTDLGVVPGGVYTRPADINTSGIVVGRSGRDGAQHAFRYENGVMADLGTLGGPESVANAINSAGVIVGSSHPRNSVFNHPFVYEGNTMRDLGTFGGSAGYAWDINDAGQIVGSAWLANSDSHAFLYQGQTLYDLHALVNAPGWLLYEAVGINDSGQIAGNGIFGGRGHAFLLTPVPEPAAIAPLGLAAAPLLRRRRRSSVLFRC